MYNTYCLGDKQTYYTRLFTEASFETNLQKQFVMNIKPQTEISCGFAAQAAVSHQLVSPVDFVNLIRLDYLTASKSCESTMIE